MYFVYEDSSKSSFAKWYGSYMKLEVEQGTQDVIQQGSNTNLIDVNTLGYYYEKEQTLHVDRGAICR